MTGPSKQEIFQKTRLMLSAAQRGMRDLIGDVPEPERVAGIYAVAVWGRSVTLVLQNLRGADPDFDDWYLPYSKEMDTDPLLRFFKRLRNEILKEGPPTPSQVTRLEFNPDATPIEIVPEPPPDDSCVRVDPSQGLLINVRFRMPDGTVEERLGRLPPASRGTSLHLSNPPTEHLGEALVNTSIEHLAQLYVAYLERLVDEAERHFHP